MWALRIFAVLVVMIVAAGFLAYVVTENPRYLHYSWRLLRYGVIVALLVVALFVLERVMVIPW